METRKIVTVVFCDLVGSTALGERHDPEATRRLIGRYFEAMRDALERHGGTVEKFIGDAVMAVFGIPTLHEDDALRAARAALDMQAALAGLGEPELAIRIGIDTGEVAVGEEPDASDRQQLATGSVVNVAARLEQAAAPGTILMGAETYRLLRDAAQAEPLGPLELKGAAGPMEAWRLLSLEPSAQAVTRRADTPFVGRSAELGELEAAFQSVVSDGACGLVTIEGPPGIGKSRLAAEMGRSLGPRALVLSGRCLPYGEGVTYSALGEALSHAVGDGLHALGAILAGEADAALVASLVTRALVGAEDAGSPDETAWAFRRVFEALARPRPLVLVIDDIHWAEPTLLDLLEYLLVFSTGASILQLCLARPELFDARPTWAAPRPRARLIRLEPLSAEETRRLVDGLVDLPGVSPEIRARIVERAAGNPLFVEQLLAMVQEAGVGADTSAPSGGLALAVPPTIRALLAARIDRLPPDERSVVEAASIEGWVFRRRAVAALLPEAGRSGLGAHFMNLVRKEFLRPDRTLFPGEDAFRFNHVLIRDAAYEAIAKSARADLHERYAAWLEERDAGESQAAEAATHEADESIGYHLEQATRYRQELGLADAHTRELAVRGGEALGRAGRRASARGDANAAVALLRRAVDVLRAEPAVRVELLPDYGQALRENGDLAGAEAVLDEGLATSHELGDERNELRAAIERRRVLAHLGRQGYSAGGTALAARAIEVFERLHDEAGLASAWFTRALSEPDFDASMAAYAQARDHALAVGDDRLMVDIWNEWGGEMLFGRTPIAEIIPFLDAEMAWAREKGYPGVEADALLAGPYLYPLLGRWEEGRAMLARSIELCQQLGIRYGLAEAYWAGARLEMLAGNWVAAERLMRAALAIHEEMRAPRYSSLVRAHLAHVLVAQGRYEQALAAADEARRMGEQGVGGSPRRDVYWRTARAKALVGRLATHGSGGDEGHPSPDLAEAVALAREATDLLADSHMLDLRAETQADLAFVLEAAGDTEGAHAALAEALRLYELKGNELMVARTREALAGLGA